MKGKSEMCSTYLHTYLILLIIEEATDQYSEKVKVNDNKTIYIILLYLAVLLIYQIIIFQFDGLQP